LPIGEGFGFVVYVDFFLNEKSYKMD